MDIAAFSSTEIAASFIGRSIVLVGMMGAGKSSVGSHLAARLGMPFRDADQEIERETGSSVPDLFRLHGEAGFRECERSVTVALLAGAPIVLATGGGAFMDPATRAAIRRHAVSIWLRGSLPLLLDRISARADRPLLSTADPALTLQHLIEARYPVYAEADLLVDCVKEGVENTTARAEAALRRWKPPHRLTVTSATNSYEVVIGNRLLPRAGVFLAPFVAKKRCVVVTDETVAALHLPTLMQALARIGADARSIVIAPGEASKSLETYARMCTELLRGGCDRDTAVIALGGGVVGDLAGFAAATALRGLRFIQIPTTLLAQVDSSVGGKTGINMADGKNLLGAFHQPHLVLADTGLLATLPPRELRAGYAELMKAGLIGDAAFFEWCRRHGRRLVEGDPDLLADGVLRACAFKAAVVSDDELELQPEGGRALLNLGHTFGHALEAEVGYGGALLHGEAVAIGLGLAFRLSAQLGLCHETEARDVCDHLLSVGLADSPGMLNRRFSATRLLAQMRRDKKNRDGKIRLILAKGVGAATVVSGIEESELVSFLRREGCDE